MKDSNKYILKLFISGSETNSVKAKNNIYKIFEKNCPEKYEIIVIDVSKNFKQALENNIFLTPTLVVCFPDKSEKKITGNLSVTTQVLSLLEINSNNGDNDEY